VTIIDDDGIAYSFSSNRYAMCSATTAVVYIDSTTIELATVTVNIRQRFDPKPLSERSNRFKTTVPRYFTHP
ncbi:hypothetical protein J6590_099445, partial [Homalodisca vitripennis]